MGLVGLNAGSQIFDPKTGTLTSEGFRLIQSLVEAINVAGGEFVTTDGEQTLTGKTIDGDSNTLQDIATTSLKTRTGITGRVVTGTAGPGGSLVSWNGNGDAIDSGIVAANVLDTSDIDVAVQAWSANLDLWSFKAVPSGDVVGTTDTQTMTNKAFADPVIFAEYTVASVPSAAAYDNGVIIVSNETGGRTLATSDATNWRRVRDGAIIS